MKRRGVVVTRQRGRWDCGIAALAMLFRLPYGDVVAAARRVFGSDLRQGLGIYELEILAAELGRGLARVYRRRGYLERATGILAMLGGGMAAGGHWVVLKAGAVVDPDGGEVWSVADYLARFRCRPATLLIEV